MDIDAYKARVSAAMTAEIRQVLGEGSAARQLTEGLERILDEAKSPSAARQEMSTAERPEYGFTSDVVTDIDYHKPEEIDGYRFAHEGSGWVKPDGSVYAHTLPIASVANRVARFLLYNKGVAFTHEQVAGLTGQNKGSVKQQMKPVLALLARDAGLDMFIIKGNRRQPARYAVVSTGSKADVTFYNPA